MYNEYTRYLAAKARLAKLNTRNPGMTGAKRKLEREIRKFEKANPTGDNNE